MLATLALALSTALPVLTHPVGGKEAPARPPHAQAATPPAQAKPARTTTPARVSKPAGASKPATVVLVGEASYYDEFHLTASGEKYDPEAFTAAVQIALRNHFGGIRPAPNYRPAYMIAEYNGKRAVLRVNNVGTMKPGRLFDLSRAAMAYFGGVRKGVIRKLKVTVLPLGRDYKLGPLSGEVEEIVVTKVKPPPPVEAAAAAAEIVTAPLQPLVGAIRDLANPPNSQIPAAPDGSVTTPGD